MDDDARLRTRYARRVATLELTGRRDANAMDLQFVQELDQLVGEVADAAREGRIDVLVLRAEGRNFCVGGDLADFAGVADAPAHIAGMAAHAHRAIGALHALEIPVVARWNGAAAGGGIGLLVAADLIVAGRSATMTAGYLAAGLTPDAGVSWMLPRMIGSARTMEILLTNRRLRADELLGLGMVSTVVEDDALDAEVDALVAAVLRAPGDSARAAKRLTRVRADDTLRAHLDAEAHTIAEFAATPHFAAVLDRFREDAAARADG